MSERNVDAEARHLIRTALDQTLVVEAAAGTGKTTELVKRILAVLRSGRATMGSLVAVTFTEKAAGELKLRLRQDLEHARHATSDPVEAGRLEQAVHTLEEAHVTTIHGFCADLLRERPVEARVDPLFRVLTEGEADRLMGRAFDRWLAARLEDPPEGVRRSLKRPSPASRPGDPDEDGPIARLRTAVATLADWRDLRTPWTRPPFDRAGLLARVTALVHQVAELTVRPHSPSDNLYVDTRPVAALSAELLRLEQAGAPVDLDDLEGRLVELSRHRDLRRARKGSGATFGPGRPRPDVVAARDELLAILTDLVTAADADLAALLQGELFSCVDAYEAVKQSEGALDFLDLLVRARDLLRDDAVVRAHFQQRFTHLFVDEFQDTDPVQAELLLLLAADDPVESRWDRVRPVPGKLFVVGDPKQAIYRFRRADVGTYTRVCGLLEAAGGMRVELHRSYRSVPGIHRFVNRAFAPVMDGDPDRHQARYVALASSRDPHPEQPAVVALPVPEPYGTRHVSHQAIEASLPDAVGAWIHWLLTASGWTVTERHAPGTRVPVQPRHVCILFRRFVNFGDDVTRPYLTALEARGVRHLLVGGKTFHDREEIETVRAALAAIEWPEDQLSVFATLRGALFAIGDEELLEFQDLGGRFHPFRGLPADLPARLAPIAEALQALAELHRGRNRYPVADTVLALLDRTRAHVGFVLRPAGEQVLANVLHVAELARQYEMQGGMSFRGFVDRLRDEATTGGAAEAPILEEGSDGVRLMTVHKAKGLEFPVVVLADITAKLTPWDVSRFVDPSRGLCALRLGGWAPADLTMHRDLELARETAEGQRVAYVAATRARDLLVVPAVGDDPLDDGWLRPLNEALYPPAASARLGAPAPGCPAFRSRDTVLTRPGGDPARPTTVSPGLHDTRDPDDAAGPCDVVWWSPEPEVLTLGAQAPVGLRRDDLIRKDVDTGVLQAYHAAHQEWQQTSARALAEAARPSRRVATVTEVAAGERVVPGDLAGVLVEQVGEATSRAARPGGTRFGSLVHALLADAPIGDVAAGDPLPALASAHGRLLGATADEIAAAVDVVRDTLAHPRLREAAAAHAEGRCHREAPITWRADDGTLVEGTVDLAYETGEGFVVVDFKTDRDVEGAVERYGRQVQLYVHAVAAATGRPARGVLLRV